MFIAAGANIDAHNRPRVTLLQDISRVTPLTMAAETQSHACVRVLVREGARIFTSTTEDNPFHLCFQTPVPHEHALATLRALFEHKNALKFFDQVDGHGHSPLFRAIRFNQTGIPVCALYLLIRLQSVWRFLSSTKRTFEFQRWAVVVCWFTAFFMEPWTPQSCWSRLVTVCILHTFMVQPTPFPVLSRS